MLHPLVSAVFDAFPNAQITDIRSQEDLDAQAAADALPELDEDDPSDDPEWDPFEDG